MIAGHPSKVPPPSIHGLYGMFDWTEARLACTLGNPATAWRRHCVPSAQRHVQLSGVQRGRDCGGEPEVEVGPEVRCCETVVRSTEGSHARL